MLSCAVSLGGAGAVFCRFAPDTFPSCPFVVGSAVEDGALLHPESVNMSEAVESKNIAVSRLIRAKVAPEVRLRKATV